MFFYAPKIIGGDGRVMIDGLAIGKMALAIGLKNISVRQWARICWYRHICETGRNWKLPSCLPD